VSAPTEEPGFNVEIIGEQDVVVSAATVTLILGCTMISL
jgi:hypothetical protein